MDHYSIWLLVQPSHWIAYCAALGVVLWPFAIGRRLRAAAAVLVVLFALVPTAWLAMHPLEQRFPVPTDLGRVDGIIVLGGAERARLSEIYGEPLLNEHGERLTTFLMLAHRYPEARLVHSGDTAVHSQSAVARAALLGAGIPPERIVFDTRSRVTCDSPTEVRRLVHVAPGERWLLVTSAAHMPRAVACFRAAGWNDVIPYPTDFERGPQPVYFDVAQNLEDLDEAAHEWLGLVYYRLRGFTHELFPGPT